VTKNTREGGNKNNKRNSKERKLKKQARKVDNSLIIVERVIHQELEKQ
jgi:hypothetical protein